MKPLSVRLIAAALGASFIGSDRTVTSVSTDTRKIETGCLFVALKGERFDGHDYLAVAVQNGAAAVLTEKQTELSVPQIVVSDTKKAYLALAAWYRSQFDIPVVGVTGSVGKTSTRDMIAAALGVRYHVHKNNGNLNNEIGLPATVLTLDDSFQAAVYEMGMNHRGEISRLSCAVKPTVGVITNVGMAHIENLGSRENILAAKLEICDGMKENAPLVLNADNDLLATVKTKNTVTFGILAPADYTAQNVETNENGVRFVCVHEGVSTIVRLPVTGTHHIYNALAAISVAGLFGIPTEEAAAGLLDYQSTGLRQHIETLGSLTLIEDCYNANPESMKAGLDTLRTLSRHRRVAVLGDMLELGVYAEEAHRAVGEYAASRADLVLTCGTYAAFIADCAEAGGTTALHFESKEQLISCLPTLLSDGDTVLFKASRGMKFEEIIEALKEAVNK